MSNAAIATAQAKFEETYNSIVANASSHRKKYVAYLIVAVLLKAVAIFGGIFIASGLYPDYAQVAGIGISCAIGVDALFSNHMQMLMNYRTAQAFEQLSRRCERRHTERIIPILRKIDLSGANQRRASEAVSEGLNLFRELLQMMHVEAEKIENALAAQQLGALESLKLEHQRQANAPVTTNQV